jgi:hypothetical protein
MAGKQGVRSKEQGARSKKPETRSRKQGARSKKQEAGSKKPEDANKAFFASDSWLLASRFLFPASCSFPSRDMMQGGNQSCAMERRSLKFNGPSIS